jgi:MFS family permease
MFALLRNRDFGLLWLAGLIAFAGNAALIIALPLHIYRLTDSTLATAVALAANVLPRILLGSVAGVFVDRWDRKRTMVVVDLARAIALLPILVAPDSLALLYAVGAVQGMLGPFFAPAEGALLPRLVGEDRLVAANALNALNDNLGMLIGPALGALLYSEIGIGGAALANAMAYVGSAALINLIAADARPERDAEAASAGSAWTRMISDWRAGLGVVRRDRALSVLFAGSSLAGVAEGVFVTLGLSPLVLDVLGGTPAQVGWLGTAQAVGGLIAGVVLVRIGQRIATRWLLGGGMAGLGMADFGAFNSFRVASLGTPAVGVAMGWMVVAGFPAVAGGAGRQVLVQEQTTDAYRGRVFGALGTIQGVAMLVGFAIGGVLGDAIGLVPVLSASAMLRVLGGLVVLLFLPRQSSRPHPTVAVSEEAGSS